MPGAHPFVCTWSEAAPKQDEPRTGRSLLQVHERLFGRLSICFWSHAQLAPKWHSAEFVDTETETGPFQVCEHRKRAVVSCLTSHFGRQILALNSQSRLKDENHAMNAWLLTHCEELYRRIDRPDGRVFG